MKAIDHPAYHLEQGRIEKISTQIGRLIEAGTSGQNWTDARRNGDNVRRRLAAMKEQTALRLTDENARTNPVRGRFDLQEHKDAPVESFYIGLQDIESVPGEKLRVIDWRAPITDLFYDGVCGPASYDNDQGDLLQVILLLRRALRVEDLMLQDIADMDSLPDYAPDGYRAGSSIADDYLADLLNSPVGGALREIVGSIQAEQHRIIREPHGYPLVLQAVAGGGKSTIALHRLAQILYGLRRQNSQPGKVAVFAPNKVLVRYVAQLLPSLLEQDIPHMTFREWAESKLGGIRQRGRLYVTAVAELPAESAALLSMKAAPEFLGIMDRYLALTAERLLPHQDVVISPAIRCSAREIWSWYQDAAARPYAVRLKHTADRFVKWAQFEADRLVKEMSTAGQTVTEIVQRGFPKASRLRGNHESKLKESVTKAGAALKEAVAQEALTVAGRWRMPGFLELYVDLISRPERLTPVVDWPSRHVKEFCAANVGVRKGRWDEADLAALMYMSCRVDGVPEGRRWVHAVVDEGQDWSVVQYAVLKRWVVDNSVTIVGDMAQGILGDWGLRDWEQLRPVFGPGDVQWREIQRSYRLTDETLRLALDVLQAGGLAVSPALQAIRHGPRPVIEKFADEADAVLAVAGFVGGRPLGDRSAAVLTPTAESAQQWLKWLKQAGVVTRGVEDRGDYSGSITVSPVFLAKGLEFDYVAVVDADPYAYPGKPGAAKLLYVALTRARQQVLVVSKGKLSPLLPGGEAEDKVQADRAGKRRRAAGSREGKAGSGTADAGQAKAGGKGLAGAKGHAAPRTRSRRKLGGPPMTSTVGNR